MRKAWFFLGVAWSAGLLTGCVDRRYVITTDPPAAIVQRNGAPLGPTPADDHFLYYGKYHFLIQKPGYEALQVDQEIPQPWYEWFPLDFVSENLIPWTIRDVNRFHYVLEPVQQPRIDTILPKAEELRTRGAGLHPPPGTQPPENTAPPAVAGPPAALPPPRVLPPAPAPQPGMAPMWPEAGAPHP